MFVVWCVEIALMGGTKVRRFGQTHGVDTHTYIYMATTTTTGPWSQLNVERGSNLLVPVPDAVGGVVIVGAQTLTYHRHVLCVSVRLYVCVRGYTHMYVCVCECISL